jgi:hypothetical protein
VSSIKLGHVKKKREVLCSRLNQKIIFYKFNYYCEVTIAAILATELSFEVVLVVVLEEVLLLPPPPLQAKSTQLIKIRA